jgi:hypothetical protein
MPLLVGHGRAGFSEHGPKYVLHSPGTEMLEPDDVGFFHPMLARSEVGIILRHVDDLDDPFDTLVVLDRGNNGCFSPVRE